MSGLQYLVVTLSLFMLFDQHWQTLAETSFLKLQYIPLFLLVLVLSIVNLMIETKIWTLLMNQNLQAGFKDIFKAVAISYTFKSVSTQYIGALLGKQHLFGIKKWKDNLLSHVKFGGIQSIATILIATGVIFTFLDLTHLLQFPEHESYFLLFGLIILLTVLFTAVVFFWRLHWKLTKAKEILTLAFIRSGLYFLQFGVLIAYFFQAQDFAMAISIIAIYFILKTLVPVFSVFGGIGLREFALLGIFSFFGMETTNIAVIGMLVWLANFIFPVLTGAIVLTKSQTWSLHTISSR